MAQRSRGTTPKHRRRTRGRLRLFIAADPPGEAREMAAAWGRETARTTIGLRPVPAENCHITLAFLGDRPEADLGVIRPTLEAAREAGAGPSPTTVSFGAPVWLPPRRPRALSLEIHDDSGNLADLQRGLAAELERAAGWREKRSFRAHLTCARTSRGFDPDRLRLPIGPALAFEIESISLYSSTLLPEGARYEVLERVPLSAL